MSNQLLPLSVAKTVPRYTPIGSFLEGAAAALSAYMKTRASREAASREFALKSAESNREDLRTRAYVSNLASQTSLNEYNSSKTKADLDSRMRQLEETNHALEELNRIDTAKGTLADQERQLTIRQLMFDKDRLNAEIQSLQDIIAGGPVGARGGRGAGAGRGGGTAEGSELKDMSKALADLLSARSQAAAQGDKQAVDAYDSSARSLAAMLPYVGGSINSETMDRADMAAKGYTPYQIDFFFRKKYGMMDPTERIAAANMLDAEAAQSGDDHGASVAAYLRMGLPGPAGAVAPTKPASPEVSNITGAMGTAISAPFDPQNYLRGLALIGKASGLLREYHRPQP